MKSFVQISVVGLFTYLSLTGCSVFGSKHNLQGSITVQGERGDFGLGHGQRGGVGDDCFTSGGYADIAEGMEVVVKNGRNETLSIGRLKGGKFSKDEDLSKACTFAFTVSQIPKADFYIVEAGRRGSKQYSFKELEEGKWKLDYSLGPWVCK